jgi:hypothetical protein
MRETFHWNSPEEISSLRDAPFEGQVLSIGDAASVRTAKLGPILGFELGSENEKERGTKQENPPLPPRERLAQSAQPAPYDLVRRRPRERFEHHDLLDPE